MNTIINEIDVLKNLGSLEGAITAVAVKKFTANPEIISPWRWTDGTAGCRTCCRENDFVKILTARGVNEIEARCHWAVFLNWAKASPRIDRINIDAKYASITLSRIKVITIGSNHPAIIMQCAVTTKIKEKEA